MINNLVYKAKPLISNTVIKYVNDALTNGWGDECYKYIELFEKNFTEYIGRKHCLITTNCTSALHLILAGLGIGSGDEVIVPDLTWTATAEPIVWQGATPVFCDVNINTWCIDFDAIMKCVNKNTKAIIAVDLYGCMPEYKELLDFCSERGIKLIEDSAEALGSEYYGIKAGTFGIASAFSFHRSKLLTMGEGGCVVTDDDNLYERMYSLRNRGRPKGCDTYKSTEVGYKYLPSNIQAAMGCGQLLEINKLVYKQIQIFNWYVKEFIGCDFIEYMTPSLPGVKNSYWMPAIKMKANIGKNISDKLNKIGISSRPCFYPLTSLDAYLYHGIHNDNPNAKYLSSHIINFPCPYGMIREDVEYICENFIKMVEENI